MISSTFNEHCIREFSIFIIICDTIFPSISEPHTHNALHNTYTCMQNCKNLVVQLNERLM